MIYKTLISTEQLASAILTSSTALVLVFDSSFDLTNPSAGEEAYHSAHIPNSYYGHLGRDLSAVKTGLNGRHPLPDRQNFAAAMGRFGLSPHT
jgi:thiosulfate/3-mercaptopyruvate sulfurtransferase